MEMSQEDRQAAIDAVIQLSKDCGIAQSLKEIGVKEEDLPTLTDSAMADAVQVVTHVCKRIDLRLI